MVKTAIAAAEAASWKIVAKMEFNMLPKTRPGAQQLRMFMMTVPIEQPVARMNRMAMAREAVPYVMEARKSAGRIPSSPVCSSLSDSTGLKEKPKALAVQVVAASPEGPALAHAEKRETV